MEVEKKVSIILPTYNEVDSVSDLIDVILLVVEKNRIPTEIIVIDDNSGDGTAAVVQGKSEINPAVKCIVRENERGLASAIKRGIMEATGDVIMIMDTDFNHDPLKIPEFINLLSYYQIVSGSRYVWGGGMLGPKWRYWGSYLFNVLIRSFLRMATKDNLSGFVAFDKSILGRMNLDEVFSGYGEYYIRFLWIAKKNNLSLIEIPVIYKMREGGKSKTNFFKYLLIYFATVLELRVKR